MNLKLKGALKFLFAGVGGAVLATLIPLALESFFWHRQTKRL